MPCTLPNFKMIIQREDILNDLDQRMDDLTAFYILMAKARLTNEAHSDYSFPFNSSIKQPNTVSTSSRGHT